MNKIQQMPPEVLIPHPRNSKKHSDAQITALGEAMQAFGFTQPIVVDEQNTILIGHARREAALSIELDTVPVIRMKGLSDADKRALLIADNRLHEVGSGWDDKKLGEELRKIVAGGVDVTLTGFGVPPGIFAPEKNEDALPEMPQAAQPYSKEGDVWHLGDHRLYVGAAESPEITMAIMAQNPNIMVTDPPYGVEYDPEWRVEFVESPGGAIGKVLNDDRADWAEVWDKFTGDVAYVWHASTKAGIVTRSLEQAAFEPKSYILWEKSSPAMSRGAYHFKHEPCVFAVRKGSKATFRGPTQSNVWNIDMVRNTTGHGTQKPVAAMRKPILAHTVEGDAVYDPFLGSGTTLIACEQTGRVCLGSELSPEYADLIVRRWELMTGKASSLVRDGALLAHGTNQQVIQEIEQ